MKRLLPIALLSFLLAGCVKQSDYDELQKKYDKLQSKYEDLEDENEKLNKELKEYKSPTANNTVDFTVDEMNMTYVNPDNDEKIELKVIQEDIPLLDITYTIPEPTEDIPEYERKVTWFVTEMVDYATVKDFPLYSIVALTDMEPDRSLSSSIVDGEIRYWGTNTQNQYSRDPDWFIDTCVDIVNNDFNDDEWLMKITESMKTEIDNCIRYQ